MATKFRAIAPLAFAMTAFFTAACGSGGSTGGTGEDAEDPGFDGNGAVGAGVCGPAAILRNTPLAAACAAGGYGGRARVVQASVLQLVSASLVDTGELPATGGTLGAKLLSLSVPDLLSAEVANANIEGDEGATRADAVVAKLDATVLGIGISADVIDAKASAKCAVGGVETSGSSLIANLKIGGIAIDVSGDPNQTIEIRGILRIVINEQIKWDDGMRVRALHVTALEPVNGGVDVIVSSADARVSCHSAPPCGGTGGGGTGGGGNSGGGGGGSAGGGGSGGGGSAGGGGTGGGGNAGGGGPNGQPEFPVGGGRTGQACNDAHPCADGYVCNRNN